MRSEPGRALLFDIDGTLANTDPLHLEAFNRTLSPHGHVFDHLRFTRELQGFSNAAIAERFLAGETPERQVAIMRDKEATFRELATAGIEPVPGLMALLDRADRAGVPMVAVTNAPRLNAEMLLDGLRITRRFRAVVIGDELAHGKPHPLPYLEGLRLAGAAASASIAFEDSRSGVRSASAAGIATVGVRTSLGHDDLVAAGAVMSVDRYDAGDLVEWLATKMGW
jgi:phosphoglycolate phosphatase